MMWCKPAPRVKDVIGYMLLGGDCDFGDLNDDDEYIHRRLATDNTEIHQGLLPIIQTSLISPQKRMKTIVRMKRATIEIKNQRYAMAVASEDTSDDVPAILNDIRDGPVEPVELTAGETRLLVEQTGGVM
ncbi:hypothetical protein HPB51_020205 [Rhipicephalus microplus]|uniref:Uncharacterized protein n=1 Tax=Rhipicephalus microplus TaxID=6941 RepID=A0A9J6D712_RHIMP|nr:hypothetical protein HPB51_020205 [Rhipicephalus microplus]